MAPVSVRPQVSQNRDEATAGVPQVWTHVDALCNRLADGLSSIGSARVLSDRSAEGRSGIVSFAVDGRSPEQVAQRLNAENFVCAARAGGVRIAPHGYNTAEEIDALLEIVNTFMRHGKKWPPKGTRPRRAMRRSARDSRVITLETNGLVWPTSSSVSCTRRRNGVRRSSAAGGTRNEL